MDVDLQDTTRQNLEYTSPKAIDNEGDEIRMEFTGMDKVKWLQAEVNADSSFTLTINTNRITEAENGAHRFTVRLGDS